MRQVSGQSWFGGKESEKAEQVFNPAIASGISSEAARWRINPPNVVVKHTGLWKRRKRLEKRAGDPGSNPGRATNLKSSDLHLNSLIMKYLALPSADSVLLQLGVMSDRIALRHGQRKPPGAFGKRKASLHVATQRTSNAPIRALLQLLVLLTEPKEGKLIYLEVLF
jgi:hypothetical protein